jgi:DNA-binding transcriptional MocR family regulator
MTIWQPDLDRSKPLYLAIADAMMRDVESGVLQKGSRLPPQRDLAWKLGVTLGTVTRAYKEAETRGLLEGEVGRGSFVRSRAHVAALSEPSAEVAGLMDLSHAIPPPVVKSEELDAAMLSVMRDPRKLDLLDYAPPEGFHLHRRMAVEWLKRSHIEISEKDVVISAGAHLGLITVLEAISEANEGVLAERTNYALLRTTFKNAHLRPIAIDMDKDGMLPDALDRAAAEHKARIIYLVPTLQNPTTCTMSARRREDIVAIARKRDLTIIEDDIFRLLDARVQPPTFYQLAPERTFHITSLSKTLAPGLRIGFLVSPLGQERILRSHIRNMAARTVGITGEIARYWIESGMAQTILERSRSELESRRNLFMQIFKDCKFCCEPGSPYAWLQVPDRWSANRFTQALASRKIRVTPESAFDLNGAGGNHIRVCFGPPRVGWQMRQAFEDIATLMQADEMDDDTPIA